MFAFREFAFLYINSKLKPLITQNYDFSVITFLHRGRGGEGRGWEINGEFLFSVGEMIFSG